MSGRGLRCGLTSPESEGVGPPGLRGQRRHTVGGGGARSRGLGSPQAAPPVPRFVGRINVYNDLNDPVVR